MKWLPRRAFVAQSWSSTTEQELHCQIHLRYACLAVLLPQGVLCFKVWSFQLFKRHLLFCTSISFCLWILQLQDMVTSEGPKIYLCASKRSWVLFLMAITKPYIICEPVCNEDSHSNTANCSQGLSWTQDLVLGEDIAFSHVELFWKVINNILHINEVKKTVTHRACSLSHKEDIDAKAQMLEWLIFRKRKKHFLIINF